MAEDVISEHLLQNLFSQSVVGPLTTGSVAFRGIQEIDLLLVYQRLTRQQYTDIARQRPGQAESGAAARQGSRRPGPRQGLTLRHQVVAQVDAQVLAGQGLDDRVGELAGLGVGLAQVDQPALGGAGCRLRSRSTFITGRLGSPLRLPRRTTTPDLAGR